LINVTIDALVQISSAVGNRVDYIQGGGGNTSVKLDANRMAIKASGFKIKDITPTNAYVIVDYLQIADYFNKTVLTPGMDADAESKGAVAAATLVTEGLARLRPSVEVGFHALLKKCVIHTHSVYANILCCSKEGEAIAGELFADIPFVWMQYVDPGARLTFEFRDELRKYAETHNGAVPSVVFMQNHGVVATHDDPAECIRIHECVNDRIRERFGLTGEFPGVSVVDVKSNTAYIKSFFDSFPKQTVLDVILYPDQLVYLNSNLEAKLDLNNLRYVNSTPTEAVTIEETMLAYCYVVENIKNAGLAMTVMSEKQIGFICSWESEKYRKTLTGGGK
jgi:ribulose-5-phosphate 4-epimerase/fuculose-1-phosphate aldolase